MIKNQTVSDFKNLKKMIEKAKSSSKHPNRVHYSKDIQHQIAKLTTANSINNICKSFGVSHTFVSRLKNEFAIKNGCEEHFQKDATNEYDCNKQVLQFMELPSKLEINESSDGPIPVIKMITSRGLHIEIFE